MASRPPVSGARRSWREAPRGAATPNNTGSKAPLRWFLTLTLLGLLVGFGFLVWRSAKPEPTTHFVALLTGVSDLLAAPPILFEKETVAPLRLLTQNSNTFRFEDASSTQSEGNIAAIESRLDQLALGAGDRLIVYVSAHGVSDNDGVPFILAPNYDLSRPTEGRYSALELIEAVHRLDVETKLLVFDCSHLAVQPRMGMAANEFAALIEEAARDIDDSRLAILLAGPELAVSPMGLAERRAVLGGALVDALMGKVDLAAGGDGDQDLTLGELRKFVVAKCANARVAAPKPALVACGADARPRNLDRRVILRLATSREMGRVDEAMKAAAAPAKNVGRSVASKAVGRAGKPGAVAKAVVGAASESASPTPAAAAPAGASTDASTAPAAADAASNALADSADAQPAPAPAPNGAADAPEGEAAAPDAAVAQAPVTGPAAGESPPSTPTGEAGAPANVVPPIVRAWRLRDQLSRTTSAAADIVTPMDYAPHLWSELNAKLVSLHLERLGLSPQGAATLDDQKILPYVRGLERLAARAAPAGDDLVTDRLNRARGDFESGELRQLNRLRDDARSRVYVDAVFDLRRHLVLATQLIEWHGALVGSGEMAGASAFGDILQLLNALERLDGALAEIERLPLDSWSDATAVLQSLEGRRRAVRKAADDLAANLNIAVSSIASSADPAAQREAEAILATGMATAKQRESLLAVLSRPSDETVPRRLSPPGWGDLLQHLQLEAKLVQLADPKMKASRDFADLLKLNPDSATADQELRLAARRFGQALHDFYAGLPARTEPRPTASLQPEEIRTTERLIAVMHPLDISAKLAKTVGFVHARLSPPAEMVLTARADSTPLREGQWTRVEWTLQLRNARGATVQATLGKFDVDALRVKFTEDDAIEAKPNATRQYQASDELTIAVLVRPKGQSMGSIASRTKLVPLEIRVTADLTELEDSADAVVVIPRPNRIDLAAWIVEPRFEYPENPNTQSVELHSYPNRSTTFRLTLANDSDEEKNLTVTLRKAPQFYRPIDKHFEPGWPPGQLLDIRGAVPKDLAAWRDADLNAAEIVAVGDLDGLLANGEPREVDLKTPGAEAPAPPPAEGAAAPPPEPKAALNIDVTHGLVCVIADKDGREEPIIKWIEIRPLRPTSYFDFDRPSLANGSIRFTARPKDVNRDNQRDLPPGMAEMPVDFVIWGDGKLFPAGRSSADAFLPSDRLATLAVLADNDAPQRTSVAMDVDGVPRAVHWDADLERGEIRENDSPASIRIARIALPAVEGGSARAYRTKPYFDLPAPTEKDAPPDLHVGEDLICAFDTSRGMPPPLQITLQVDAPRDAFNSVGDGSSVVVLWDDEEGGQYNLYKDRDVQSTVTGVTPDGDLVITTQVKDFVFPFDPYSVNNAVVPLVARLILQGKESMSDRLIVVFDQNPPKINVAASTKVELGQLARINLSVVDLSGIERIEAWFLPTDKPPSIEALDPKTAQILRLPYAQRPPANRDGSEPEPPPYPLTANPPQKPATYYLVVRVTDRSGQSSDTLREEHVVEVFKRKLVEAPPLEADLRGRVVLGNGRPAPNATVTLEAEKKPKKTTKTNAEGVYVFPRVKAGETYKLVVSGFLQGPLSGELEVTPLVLADFMGNDIPAEIDWNVAPPPQPAPP